MGAQGQGTVSWKKLAEVVTPNALPSHWQLRAFGVSVLGPAETHVHT